MVPAPMDRVTTEATIENLEDLWDAERGRLSADKARRVTVVDALVDRGVTLLSLPTRLIQQLGLENVGTKGHCHHGSDVYDPVRLTIQGRSCTKDVLEVPDGVPVLIGQLPLDSGSLTAANMSMSFINEQKKCP